MSLSILHGFFWRSKRRVGPGTIEVQFTVTGSGTAQRTTRKGGGRRRFRNLPSWQPIRKAGGGSMPVHFEVTGSGIAHRQGESTIECQFDLTGAGNKNAFGQPLVALSTALAGSGLGDHSTEIRQRMEDELVLAGVL